MGNNEPNAPAAFVPAVYEELRRLAHHYMRSERGARIVELRFFTGLTVEQTADALETPAATVKRDWATAKA